MRLLLFARGASMIAILASTGILVAFSVYIGNTEDSFGKVHIMKEFRLKWFEKGTGMRRTKKGANRGSISPKWFFRSAVDAKAKEAEQNLDKNISESIMKAFNKK